MTLKKAKPARKWYLAPRFLMFLGAVFVVAVILTRNLYEPLAGMLIFWATLIVPAVLQDAWQRAKQVREAGAQPQDKP